MNKIKTDGGKMKKLLIISAAVSVLFFGCSNFINDAAEPIDSYSSMIEKPEWVKAAELQGYEFIYLPEFNQNTLNKISTVTRLCRVNSSTTLGMNYNYVTSNARNVSVKIDLTVPAKALNKDEYISFTLNDSTIMTDVDLTFGPHGTKFNTPALLNIDAKGLDLSGYPKNSVFQLAYYNPITRLFEIMNADQLSVNFNSGSLKLVNGKLPHFSRYCFIRKDGTTTTTFTVN